MDSIQLTTCWWTFVRCHFWWISNSRLLKWRVLMDCFWNYVQMPCIYRFPIYIVAVWTITNYQLNGIYIKCQGTRALCATIGCTASERLIWNACIEFIIWVYGKPLKFTTILLDFTKAFDRVPHDELLLKLRKIGIGGTLWRWSSPTWPMCVCWLTRIFCLTNQESHKEVSSAPPISSLC